MPLFLLYQLRLFLVLFMLQFLQIQIQIQIQIPARLLPQPLITLILILVSPLLHMTLYPKSMLIHPLTSIMSLLKIVWMMLPMKMRKLILIHLKRIMMGATNSSPPQCLLRLLVFIPPCGHSVSLCYLPLRS